MLMTSTGKTTGGLLLKIALGVADLRTKQQHVALVQGDRGPRSWDEPRLNIQTTVCNLGLHLLDQQARWTYRPLQQSMIFFMVSSL